jgi:uncharacterized membrane protein YgcG
MASHPPEFGKRRPAAPALSPSPPVKRSSHVALLMMGTLAVGGGAYALMPRANCQPTGSGMATPSSPEAAACASRASSSGGHGGSGGWWSRSSFYGGSSSSSGTSTSPGATETTRGGFGGFAHSIAAHFSGG